MYVIKVITRNDLIY